MLTRDNFEDSLRQPLAFWENKTADQVCALAGPEAARMVGFDQHNPHHCYDLWLHTLHTIDALPPDAPSLLRTAAFFHDIGKPEAAAWKSGRLVYYDHEDFSCRLAGPALRALGYTPDQRREILFYIRHHHAFISWVLPSEQYNRRNPYLVEITPDHVRALIQKEMRQDDFPADTDPRTVWMQLLALCRADAMAQAESGMLGGRPIETRRHKVMKVDRIREMAGSLDFAQLPGQTATDPVNSSDSTA